MLGELLDQSDSTIKDLAYNLQRSVPRYRVRKQNAPLNQPNNIDQNQTQDYGTGHPAQAVLSAAVMFPPQITTHAYDDDRRSTPLMMTLWIDHTRMLRTLLDGGSLIKLISQKAIHRMKNKPYISNNGSI